METHTAGLFSGWRFSARRLAITADRNMHEHVCGCWAAFPRVCVWSHSQETDGVTIVIVPILQLWKLRHRQTKGTWPRSPKPAGGGDSHCTQRLGSRLWVLHHRCQVYLLASQRPLGTVKSTDLRVRPTVAGSWRCCLPALCHLQRNFTLLNPRPYF